jgi:hypothetical protein
VQFVTPPVLHEFDDAIDNEEPRHHLQTIKKGIPHENKQTKTPPCELIYFASIGCVNKGEGIQEV